jgi:hypothetical protein
MMVDAGGPAVSIATTVARASLCAVTTIALAGASAGCGPSASDGGVLTDARLLVPDGGGSEAAVLDAEGRDGAGRDRAGEAGPWLDAALDAGTWREDAGVAYESYLACLQGAAVTLGSCFDDARNRAAIAGPPQLAFARAVASVDAQGHVPADRAGLTYHFCRPDGGLFDCLIVDYWWSGVTAQITLTRVHRTGDGQARARGLDSAPDSPEILQQFLQTPDCDLGLAGYASVSAFAEAGQDRLRVLATVDSLLLSDPGLAVLEDGCTP